MKKTNGGKFIFALAALTIAFSLASCAPEKAGPAVSTDFVRSGMMSKFNDLPFHKAWFKEGIQLNQYSNIYIAPVDTTRLLKMDWWDNLERENDFKNDLKDLALFTQTTFINAFNTDPGRRFKIVGYPAGEKTLIFEISLTEVIPNKAVLQSLSYAGGPVARGVGMVAGSVFRSTVHSTVAFEARIKDALTKEVIAMFADRESEKASLFNVNDFTWYGHAKSIIQEWADQFVQVLKKKNGEVIEDSESFQWKAW